MTLDLEKGYTRVTLHQGGLAAGRQHMREMPAGGPHAVISGERDTLCGRVVSAQLPLPLGMGETQCAEELAKLESAD